MIRLSQLRKHAQSIVGTEPAAHIDVDDIVNQAGRHLVSMYPWRWRLRPVRPVSFIAPITVTDSTWTESSLTITKTGGFADYTFRNAELFEVEDGTDANTGNYTIASRTSDDAIVLESSVGSAADGNTDIDGRIDFPYAVLPDDFGSEGGGGQILGVNHEDSIVTMAVPADIVWIRTARRSNIQAPITIYWAVVYPSQVDTDTAPGVPLLEMYPSPTALDVSALFVTYLAGWTDLGNDSTTDPAANIPAHFEHLLIRYVRAVAKMRGFDDSDMLRDLDASPEMLRLKTADGMSAGNRGQMRGGILQAGRTDPRWNYTVTGPTQV